MQAAQVAQNKMLRHVKINFIVVYFNKPKILPKKNKMFGA